MVKYSFMLYSAISSVNLFDVPLSISSIRITKVHCRIPTPHKFILIKISGLDKNIFITNATAVYYSLSLPLNNTPDYALTFLNNEDKNIDGLYLPSIQLSTLDFEILTDDGFLGTTTLNDIQPNNNMYIELEIL